MKLILMCFLFTSNSNFFSTHNCLYNEDENPSEISIESYRFTKRVFQLITRNLITLYNYPYNSNPPIINDIEFYVHEDPNMWAPITKAAHAFAHQFDTDNNWFNNLFYAWDREAMADYTAGFLLNKMGASLQEAQQSAFNGHAFTNRKRCYFLTAGYLRALYD